MCSALSGASFDASFGAATTCLSNILKMITAKVREIEKITLDGDARRCKKSIRRNGCVGGNIGFVGRKVSGGVDVSHDKL